MTLPTLSLSKATNSEINTAVARHVDVLEPYPDDRKEYVVPRFYHRDHGIIYAPEYLHDANLVLALLSKAPLLSICRVYKLGPNGLVDETLPLWWRVTLGAVNEDGLKPYNDAPTFCRAAVIALLRASRKVEVIP